MSRAYSEIHETRAPLRIRWKAWSLAFPRAFRRHLGAFRLSVGITLLGCAFGWFVDAPGPAGEGRADAFPGPDAVPGRARCAAKSTPKIDRYHGREGDRSPPS